MNGTIGNATSSERESALGRLTARQRECLEWVYRGFETKEIARELGLSPQTIDMHIKNATKRLGVSSRRAAARLIHSDEIIPQSLVPPSVGMFDFTDIEEAQGLTSVEVSNPSVVAEAVGLPVPTLNRPSNQLTVMQRLFWIAAIAVGVSVGFGAIVSSLETLGRLLRL